MRIRTVVGGESRRMESASAGDARQNRGYAQWPRTDKLKSMSSELHNLNRIGTPPPGRSIHRRRAQIEAEIGDEDAASSSNALVVSIIVCGTVVVIGLAIGWLVWLVM